MAIQANQFSKQSSGLIKVKAPVWLLAVVLVGCFGPPTMHYDVQEYNKQVVSSEKQMLLFNIGELHYNQPPHFMMVSSVSQSRTFSGSAGFSWANPVAWMAGPFTATGTESPTITFVPIQGQDFAQRFESPLTDKFSLFSEDLSWSAPRSDLINLVDLFAQSLDLTHGNTGECQAGRYYNRDKTEDDDKYTDPQNPYYYSPKFSDCVEKIVYALRDVEQIDGDRAVPTSQAEDPKSADLVTALQAGYKWAKKGKDFRLTNPMRIPGWFDYTPSFVSPPDQKPKSSEPLPPVWSQLVPPNWKEINYLLPKNYQWKKFPANRDPTRSAWNVYALVPDGYGLARDANGYLKCDKNALHCVSSKLATHLAAGKRHAGSSIITDTGGTISTEDVGRDIVGMGIPSDAKVVDAKANTATMSRNAELDDSKDAITVGDDLKPSYSEFSYANAIVNDLWPAPYDNVYVELRGNGVDDINKAVDDAKAERLCISKPDKNDPSNLICGYFKVGNFLQIMQRLADAACHTAYNAKDCAQGIFGIGIVVPSWADTSATFIDPDGIKESVWVPAHDPESEPKLAERDRREFFTLYKLYQMSLVDTSKLVTAAPSITIPK